MPSGSLNRVHLLEDENGKSQNLTITKATELEKESFNMLFEFLDLGENSCKLKCVSVCVCVCLCVCVFMSIYREGFICLDQLECQGTDQQCCVVDVSFLCQVSSSLL